MISKGSQASFLSFPRNEMALANESVQLQCSTGSEKPLRWYVTYSGTTETKTLFGRGNLSSAGESKYRIDTSARYNLIIDSVDLSHAGTYICAEEPFGLEVEAKLAVIGKIKSFYFSHQHFNSGNRISL